MSLMAQVEPEVFAAVAAASPIAAGYATDTDPESAKELLAARMAQAAEAEPTSRWRASRIPSRPTERRMRPTQAPEKGVDWGDVAQEGARFARSGAFNTILRAVLGILGGRR